MKHIDWNEQKNALLKFERGICFEDVQTVIEENRVLDDTANPNQARYTNQRIFFVQINHYVYIVPYVEDDEKIFLKTIIPSRKATKKYLKGDI